MPLRAFGGGILVGVDVGSTCGSFFGVLFSVCLFFFLPRYPHEDIWPAGCFVHEGISTGTEKQKVATLVFNDNFESEALCQDNGQVIGSMRCLCRPKTARYIFFVLVVFIFF